MAIEVYRPRSPNHTTLYRVVSTHLPAFLAHLEQHDRPMPEFVREEFERFLGCGQLEHGFARVTCHDCGFDRLVAFSCKGRGICPSCTGRRMADWAAHMVDAVLPRVPMRQWVLTVPPPLRYRLAWDTDLANAVLGIFHRVLFRWHQHRAKWELGLRSITLAHPGAITALQRFGSALNLNVHLHTVAMDGVFIQTHADAAPSFHALPPPTDGDIMSIAWDVCKRVQALLRKRGLDTESEDAFAQDQPLLAATYAASIQYTVSTGARAGQRVLRLLGAEPREDKRAHGFAHGFNLHAKTFVAAHDRKRLEKLLRYIARPPISQDRLVQRPDGKLQLRLKTPWSDGSTHIVLSPFELLEKLTCLVPPPRKNQLRYAGIFAPNHRLRAMVVPAAPDDTPMQLDLFEKSCKHEPDKKRRKNIGWAKLIARVFKADVFECPKCFSKMQRVEWVTKPDDIRAVLQSAGLATGPPTPSAHSAQLRFDFAA